MPTEPTMRISNDIPVPPPLGDRPRTSAVRTKVVCVRLTKEEAVRVLRIAKEKDQTMSEFVEEALFVAVDDHIRRHGIDVRDLNDG